ncbi:hypothetical protein [Pseudoclavibacter caeni]|uniref:Uncharacterized protein n=1 Tax=Pseudoclavibacter caeni TaxID=908846 RepID=A0A7C8FRL1_9MICO|nr:hypothetical protein [Pseudoclavibacter caeni]KAB1632965.1 hypothetical protein F8O02_03675 [Pseudoclavibacter caeni]NYJ97063.1 hypothetical protein [Pseudoclavibacter caeni]
MTRNLPVKPVVRDGRTYYPLERADQLPEAVGDDQHFTRAGVPVRFTRVSGRTWVVHREDRPGSTGVLVLQDDGRYLYSASAAADSGFPGWRIPVQRLTWESFLDLFTDTGEQTAASRG